MSDKLNYLFENNSLINCFCSSISKENNNFETKSFAFGNSKQGIDDPINGDSLFRIFSMSKVVTTIAVMQLVEKEELNLDEPVENILPYIKKVPILNENNQFVKQKNSITLRNLLSHTSGFSYSSSVMETSKRMKNLPASKKLYLSLKGYRTKGSIFNKGPRLFEAGTNIKYGTGIGIAGNMLEKVTGVGLDEYCKENIFNPLSMENTFFEIPKEKQDKLVGMYIRRGKNSDKFSELPLSIPPVKRTFLNKIIFGGFYGGTDVFSSPNDFTILIKCLLDKGTFNGYKMLKEETIEEMSKPGPGSYDDMWDRDDNPQYVMGENTRLKSNQNKYGLGLTVSYDNESHRPVGSVCHGGAGNTFFSLNYESKKAALIFSNFYPYNDPEWFEMLQELEFITYENN